MSYLAALEREQERLKKLEAIAEAARAYCWDTVEWPSRLKELKATVDALYGEKNEER